MTVPAVDAVVGDVMHVTELERLFDEEVLPGDIARSGEHDRQKSQAADEEKKTEDADFGERVSAATKYLGHRRCVGATTV
jgi:hypothetical protein